MIDIQITDEHLEKLDINENSILLIRVPPENLTMELVSTLHAEIGEYIRDRIGIIPGLIILPRDVDLTLLSSEDLHKLKAEINVIILKKHKV